MFLARILAKDNISVRFRYLIQPITDRRVTCILGIGFSFNYGIG